LIVICADRRTDDQRAEYPVQQRVLAAHRATLMPWCFGRGAPAWRAIKRVTRDRCRPPREGRRDQCLSPLTRWRTHNNNGLSFKSWRI
jgi:hypothetical protein